jgi:hypothetical protein
MNRPHRWAALRDRLGNLWCAWDHYPHGHWAVKDPERLQWRYTDPGVQAWADQVVNRFVTLRCQRCGREWSVDRVDEIYVALTQTHLDAARATDERGP